jgi:hypothetical protein
MRMDLTGPSPVVTAGRIGLFAAGFAVLAALGACTTVEGTNAMTDVATFEREVMTSTLEGVGLLDRETKPETNSRRAPLVLPKSTSNLPAPRTDTTTAMLPEDSNTVRIDASGMSEADLKRLRGARVLDIGSLTGRPMTDSEARQLAARMQAANPNSSARPLYLPPEEYFTTINGQDVVCLAANGDLVPVNDPKCPAAVRRALQQ